MFCPHCGNQTANDSRSCSSCGCGLAQQPETRSRIVRPLNPRMLAGVCSGFAIHFGWDVTMTRMVLAVAFCLTTGAVILPYLLAWAVLPNASFAMRPPTRYVGSGDMGEGSAV